MLTLVLIFSNVGMTKAAVLPVPCMSDEVRHTNKAFDGRASQLSLGEKAALTMLTFFALARISLPASAIGIASSWIGDGFSNWKKRNVRTLVSTTELASYKF